MKSPHRIVLSSFGFMVLVLGIWFGGMAPVLAQTSTPEKKGGTPANPVVEKSASEGTSSQATPGTSTPVDYEAKERALKAKLAGNSKDIETAYDLGNLYYDQGKRDEAEQAYRQALRIQEDYVPALVNLGVVLNEAGKSNEALVEFDKALALKPDDGVALCNKGQALYALKRYTEAVALYQKAIDLEPKSQMAHYWMGVAFADAGIYKEAIAEWRKVVEIDPQSENAGTAKDGIAVLEQILMEGK